MANATIAVLHLGREDYPEIDFCWLFLLAFQESISCFLGIPTAEVPTEKVASQQQTLAVAEGTLRT